MLVECLPLATGTISFACCLDGCNTVQSGRRAPTLLITYPGNIMKVEIIQYSETSVNVYQTERYQIPEANIQAQYF